MNDELKSLLTHHSSLITHNSSLLLRLRVLFVGRPKNRALNDAAADYALRIGRYCDFFQREVKSAEQALETVSKSRLVALDPTGRDLDSGQFARWLEKRQNSGVRELVFLVGGADGLPAVVRDQCELLSLSRLTLPHELARVVLLEQIYRAYTILRGHPYSR